VRPVTGDCVSRGQSHAAIASLANAVQNGSGSWPSDIPEASYKSGMPFHPTPTYWCKRGSESGWSCGSAASRSKDEIGLTVMKSYPDNPNIGDLLLKYNTSVIKKYCRSGPPPDVAKTLNYNMTLTYSRTKTFEEMRDAIANGYGIASCGSAGFGKGSSARDSNGFCKRSGSWNHSMCTIGCDDTEWAHKNYGSALYLVLNSWASYLGNARPKVQGRDDIPPIPRGSFWCLANSKGYGGRDSYVISSLQGYPPQKLKNWDLRGLI
jgi:hypothetical protein